MEMPDMSAARAQASKAMDSAKSLGTQATAKANAGVSMLTTSASDTIQAIDGYGKKATDVLTETKSTLVSKINEARSWLTNTSIGSLGSLNDILSKAAEAKRDAQALQDQITKTVSTGIGTVRGLTNSVLGPAEDTLWKLQQIPFDKMTDGKYWLDVAVGTSVDEVNSLGNLTKNFLNRADLLIDGYKDQYGEISMAVGLSHNATTIGNSAVLDAVLEKYGSQAEVRESVMSQFPDAINQGNTALLKTIITRFGKDYVLVKYPTAIQMILEGYRVPIGTTTNDFGTLGTALVEVLSMLDPTWWGLKTVPNANVNLKVFTYASVSSQRVLATQPDLGYAIKIAANYTNATVLGISRTHYPNAGFGA